MERQRATVIPHFSMPSPTFDSPPYENQKVDMTALNQKKSDVFLAPLFFSLIFLLLGLPGSLSPQRLWLLIAQPGAGVPAAAGGRAGGRRRGRSPHALDRPGFPSAADTEARLQGPRAVTTSLRGTDPARRRRGRGRAGSPLPRSGWVAAMRGGASGSALLAAAAAGPGTRDRPSRGAFAGAGSAAAPELGRSSRPRLPVRSPRSRASEPFLCYFVSWPFLCLVDMLNIVGMFLFYFL